MNPTYENWLKGDFELTILTRDAVPKDELEKIRDHQKELFDKLRQAYFERIEQRYNKRLSACEDKNILREETIKQYRKILEDESSSPILFSASDVGWYSMGGENLVYKNYEKYYKRGIEPHLYLDPNKTICPIAYTYAVVDFLKHLEEVDESVSNNEGGQDEKQEQQPGKKTEAR